MNSRTWIFASTTLTAVFALTAAGCSSDDTSSGPAVDASTIDASHAEAGSDGSLNEAAADVTTEDAHDSSPETIDAADGAIEAANGIIDAASEASADLDASADAADSATVCNSITCGGACCGNTCVARTCAGCNLGTTLCPYDPTLGVLSNGTCVADCTACATTDAAAPVTCFTCNSGAAKAYCANGSTQCPADVDSGACTCELDGGSDGGSCPGASQVCISTDASASECLSCGQANTNGLSCTNGTTCSQTSGTCGP